MRPPVEKTPEPDRRLDLAPLVTARFPLARVGDALQAARDPAQLKIVIDMT